MYSLALLPVYDELAMRCSWAGAGRAPRCPRAGPWCWRAPPRTCLSSPAPPGPPELGAWAAWIRGRGACSTRSPCGPGDQSDESIHYFDQSEASIIPGVWALGRARSRPCRRPPGSPAPTCCDLDREWNKHCKWWRQLVFWAEYILFANESDTNELVFNKSISILLLNNPAPIRSLWCN